MKYGNVNLSYRPGSLVISPAKAQIIRHYLVTNTSDKVSQGRPPTRILCTLIAKSEEQKILIEQLLHGDQEADLVLAARYYRRVVTGGDPQGREITSGGIWEYNAEFIALDPIPYSTSTDEPLW